MYELCESNNWLKINPHSDYKLMQCNHLSLILFAWLTYILIRILPNDTTDSEAYEWVNLPIWLRSCVWYFLLRRWRVIVNLLGKVHEYILQILPVLWEVMWWQLVYFHVVLLSIVLHRRAALIKPLYLWYNYSTVHKSETYAESTVKL